MRRAITYVLAIVLAIPLAFIATFLCSPFWNWFESATGIESYGHSGPSDWCFWLTYVLLLLCLFTAIIIRSRRN